MYSADLIDPDVLICLEVAQADYPDVFLAGGYLRDKIMGLEPKDVDFWTWLPLLDGRRAIVSSETSSVGRDRLAAVEWMIEPCDIDAYDAGFTTDVPLSWVPVEIIHLLPHAPGPAKLIVSDFAFGLQQAYFDPRDNEFWVSDAFHKDLADKTMTVCRTRDEAEAMNIHRKYERLMGSRKFPGFCMVIPVQYRSLYQFLQTTPTPPIHPVRFA